MSRAVVALVLVGDHNKDNGNDDSSGNDEEQDDQEGNKCPHGHTTASASLAGFFIAESRICHASSGLYAA